MTRIPPAGTRQPTTGNQARDPRETRDQPLTTDYRLLTTDYRLHFSTDFPILRLHLARRSCVERRSSRALRPRLSAPTSSNPREVAGARSFRAL
jgi:hypothetical protein